MKGKLYQVVTALACGLSTTCFGLMFVWPSYTLPMLASNNTILSAPLTAGNEAMLGSLPSLGGIIGTMLVGTLIDSMGRKWSSITGSVIMMISWCIVAFTNSITVVLVARFLGGVSCGLALVITPIYISEIAEDRVRGILSSVMVLLYSLGLLISYFIGWYFSYQAIAWINFAFSAARGLMLLFVPESPVYLIKKRRVEDARTAMSKFRGVLPTSLTVHQELCRIKRDLSSSLPLELVNGDGEEAEEKTLTTEEYKEEQNTTDEKFAALKTLCKEPSSRRAFLIVIVTFSNEILMGIDSISVFANQVFHEADPSKADLCSVLLAVIWCCANLLSGVLSDRMGRRPLLIGSSYLVAACLVTLGVLLQTRIAPAWVTATCIMLYCFFFMLGAGTVPYMLLSEVFNPKVQTLASMLITEWIWLVGFVILAVFNWLNRLIGIHATFYIFAFNALFNATFSYFLVPETKGLSNKEIQVALLKGRRK